MPSTRSTPIFPLRHVFEIDPAPRQSHRNNSFESIDSMIRTEQVDKTPFERSSPVDVSTCYHTARKISSRFHELVEPRGERSRHSSRFADIIRRDPDLDRHARLDVTIVKPPLVPNYVIRGSIHSTSLHSEMESYICIYIGGKPIFRPRTGEIDVRCNCRFKIDQGTIEIFETKRKPKWKAPSRAWAAIRIESDNTDNWSVTSFLSRASRG